MKQWNIYMDVGYLAGPGLTELAVDKMLYDRFSFDFDSEESPATAVAEAPGFASLMYEKYGVKTLVFGTVLGVPTWSYLCRSSLNGRVTSSSGGTSTVFYH